MIWLFRLLGFVLAVLAGAGLAWVGRQLIAISAVG